MTGITRPNIRAKQLARKQQLATSETPVVSKNVHRVLMLKIFRRNGSEICRAIEAPYLVERIVTPSYPLLGRRSMALFGWLADWLACSPSLGCRLVRHTEKDYKDYDQFECHIHVMLIRV